MPNDAAPAAPTQAQPVPHQGGMPSFDSLPDDNQTYGTPGQQALAGAEGVARGLAGPLATAAEKYVYRVPEESIRGRQQANPITSAVGEGAGLLGGALTGTGEAALLEKIGHTAADAAGLAKGSSYGAKVGSAIVKNAAEMAAYQAGDEVTKVILADPSVGAQSAIANIGLGAALGGVGGGLIAGVASPLWNATTGSKIGAGLKAMFSRWGGIEGAEAGSALSKADDLASKVGIELPDEIKATINEQPGAMEKHSVLSQDDSSIAGRKYQKTLGELDEVLGNKTAEALGRTPEQVINVGDRNAYETGQNLGIALHDSLKPTIDEIGSRYEAIENKFKTKENSPSVVRQIADDLSQKMIQEGWHKSSEPANMNRINKILEKLPEQTTINDLKKEISNLHVPFDAPDARAVQAARKIMTNGIESSISEHMGPEELAHYSNLRSDYAKLSNHLEELDEHLHVGKWNGPKSFLEALKDKANNKGEALLSNMTNKNNAALLENLSPHRGVLDQISNHYKDEAIRKAAKAEGLSTGKLLSEIEKLTPQQKALIASPENHAKIEAAHAIKEALHDPTHNFSNTARTLRKQMHGSVTPLAFIAGAFGHADAGIMSYFAKMGLDEGKAGLKLAMLKALGSQAPVDAAGFAAAGQYFTAADKGARVLSKAAENIFRPGTQVIMSSQMPTAMEIQRLDKLVASNDPKTNEKIMRTAQNGHVGHYLPDHQTALTASSTQALQYLRNLRPDNQQTSPLDPKMPPTPSQQARYDRALQIAQQPAIVLQHVKNGTIQTSDLQDLQGMYPALYPQLAQKVSNEIIRAKSEGVVIPYKTRIGTSLFLGQPLDSTMVPSSIMSAQPQPKTPPAPAGPKMSTKRGTSTLGKSNSSYRTPNQTAEADRSDRS